MRSEWSRGLVPDNGENKVSSHLKVKKRCSVPSDESADLNHLTSNEEILHQQQIQTIPTNIKKQNMTLN